MSQYSPEELEGIAELKKNEKFAGLDDHTFVRFLRARNNNIDDTTTMLLAYMEWRERVKPDQVTMEDLPNALPTW
jgi:hypothetical protein